MPKHLTTQCGPAAPLTSTPLLKPSLPSHAPPAVKSGTQGGGQALDKRTSAEMSAKFGHDFSTIRVHTDSRAGDAADAMGANAYALGSDIVFGAGKFQPGSPETDRLLAHELTHVVQQDKWGGPGDWGRTSRKGDASEREADSLASQVMMGRRVDVQSAPEAALARDEDDGDGGVPASVEPDAPNQSIDPGQSFQPTPMAGDPQPQAAPSCDSQHPDLCSDYQSRQAADNEAEANTSVMWDTLGAIPIVGTITSGVAAATDLAKAAYHGVTGQGDKAGNDLKDAVLDGAGMVPIAGQKLSAEELAVDTVAAKRRHDGASAEQAPTYAQQWEQGFPTWKDITSPFTDPDSWTPQGPSN